MRSSNSVKYIVLAVIAALNLNGCAMSTFQAQQATIKEAFMQTFASDDPCANNSRNIGMITGALLGGVIGNLATHGNDKALGTLLGVGLGGAVGAFIGYEVDQRQCELSKIQKKHGLEMQVLPLAVEPEATETAGLVATDSTLSQCSGSDTRQAESSARQKIGLSVSVVDQKGKPQFMSGSDELHPAAKVQFSEIASQYATDKVVTKMGANSSKEKQKMTEELHKKHILLIGHTDDTGSSDLNAKLSERRARAVAQVFKSMGVTEEQLFYQGAGETLPIADNATEEGRAKNRRVEIVDLSNEKTFKID